MKKGKIVLKKGQCDNCSELKVIVNKNKNLCGYCDIQRKNKDKPIKKPSLLKSVPIIKKASKINKVSQKQKEINKDLKKIYEERGKVEKNSYCGSCLGTSFLTHSHLVPRSYNKKLITDPENLITQCVTCHGIYEARDIGGMRKFKNYQEILDKIMHLDINFYQFLLEKIEKYEK